MTYDKKKAGALMLKVMAGIDIMDSALVDMKIDDESDKKLYNLILEAKEATGRVISEYDSLVKNGSIDYLCEIYEECNKAVDWKLKKILKL